MEEDSPFTKRFVSSVKKPHCERTEQDIDYICHVLKKLSEFSGTGQNNLRSLSEKLVYEEHCKDSILYRVGEPVLCWYYVLSGSVLISEDYLYSSGNSFGHCSDSNIRKDSCHILEASELLRVEMQRPETTTTTTRAESSNQGVWSQASSTTGRHSAAGAATIGAVFSAAADEDDAAERKRRSQSEERVFKFDNMSIQANSESNPSLALSETSEPNARETTPPKGSTSTASSSSGSTEVRLRVGRENRRRYSAPPGGRQSRDSVGSLDYLSESQVDSDDEESVQSETSSSSMDAVLEVFSKPPSDRTEEDIDRVLEILQYMSVFSNMTANIRQALFKELMLLTYETEGAVVINNHAEVSNWYVVLNGQVRLLRDTEPEKTYHVGECFGVNQSLKVLPHRGRLITAAKDTTLCYVPVDCYGRILAHGEENMMRIEEDGVVVMVMEKRSVDIKREGYFVISSTPNKLLEHMLEETVDDYFYKDFLLTYRTFLDNGWPIVRALKQAWSLGSSEKKERIIAVVLHWVSEHFSDFECNEEMTGFLDWFETSLLQENKLGEKRALDTARTQNAKLRDIDMDREATGTPLNFTVVGGWEVGCPIFISRVETTSIPSKAGLRIGDQILQINETSCEKKELREITSILVKNFKLSLRVKSNLPEFKNFMQSSPSIHPDYKSKSPAPLPMIPHIPISRCNSEAVSSKSKGSRSKAFSSHKKPKILKPFKPFEKFKLRVRSSSNAESMDGPLKATKKKIPLRKLSQEDLLSEPVEKPSAPVRASSLEDLPSSSSSAKNLSTRFVDSVVKLYVAPDHSYKYIDVSPTTTVTELISKAVKEFYPDRIVVSPADEFCVCLVTVQSRNGPIRNSVLPNHLTDLANYIQLESRYYLKERAFHGTLVHDEEAEKIFKESKQWENLLNLHPKQLAEELTRQDSEIFSSIDSSEYIADLWRNPDHLAKQNLQRFEDIPNEEMYWVVTTLVSETKSEVRAKFIKQFIKTARYCRDLKNFNSMFHIVSGLNHPLCDRLKSTWDKVPSKYKRTLQDLTTYMNPFHNMAKYRELQRSTQPPIIPFFPIIKKDLTFLFDGNDSEVHGLVNFEKLRMLSRQIRIVKSYCRIPINPEPPHIDLNQVTSGILKSLHNSIRMRKHNPATLLTLTENALKKMHCHHRMVKMVRRHLGKRYIVKDEELLEKIAESNERMVQIIRKNPPSPLNKGKKTAAFREKHKSVPPGVSVGGSNISPSPTTGSFGSEDSSAAFGDMATPPLSPRRISMPLPVSSLSSSLCHQDQVDSPSRSLTDTPPPNNFFDGVNGSAKYATDC